MGASPSWTSGSRRRTARDRPRRRRAAGFAPRPRRGARGAPPLAATAPGPARVVDSSSSPPCSPSRSRRCSGSSATRHPLGSSPRSSSSRSPALTSDRRPEAAWGAAVAALFFLAFLVVYLAGFYNLETDQALAHRQGNRQVRDPLPVPSRRGRLPRRRCERSTGRRSRCSSRGSSQTRATASSSSVGGGAGGNLDESVLSPITGGASRINIYGAIGGETSSGRTRSPAIRTTSGSCSSCRCSSCPRSISGSSGATA